MGQVVFGTKDPAELQNTYRRYMDDNRVDMAKIYCLQCIEEIEGVPKKKRPFQSRAVMVDAKRDLGLICSWKEQWDEAVTAQRECIEWAQGYLAEGEKQLKAAADTPEWKAFRANIERRRREMAEDWFLLGGYHLQDSGAAKATKAWLAALNEDPEHVRATVALTEAFSREGKGRKALKHIEVALKFLGSMKQIHKVEEDVFLMDPRGRQITYASVIENLYALKGMLVKMGEMRVAQQAQALIGGLQNLLERFSNAEEAEQERMAGAIDGLDLGKMGYEAPLGSERTQRRAPRKKREDDEYRPPPPPPQF